MVTSRYGTATQGRHRNGTRHVPFKMRGSRKGGRVTGLLDVPHTSWKTALRVRSGKMT